MNTVNNGKSNFVGSRCTIYIMYIEVEIVLLYFFLFTKNLKVINFSFNCYWKILIIKLTNY